MITAFSRILIDVPNLQSAETEYQCLLGAIPAGSLRLRNVEIVLQENTSLAAAAITGLALLADGDTPVMDQQRGLHLPMDLERQLAGPGDSTATGICAVDHIVLRTRDADDCIRLFGENGYGMRLALDQMVPKWGGRMLFFRCGKMTLEIIHNIEEPPEQDLFWGVTYLCEDMDFTLDQLNARGVEHSAARTGRKAGTRVATIHSHNLGLPTLLIEPM
jgi:hypothetical protein